MIENQGPLCEEASLPHQHPYLFKIGLDATVNGMDGITRPYIRGFDSSILCRLCQSRIFFFPALSSDPGPVQGQHA